MDGIVDAEDEYDDVPPELAIRLPRPPTSVTMRYNRVCIVEWLYPDERKTGEQLQDFLRRHKPDAECTYVGAHSKQDVLRALDDIARATEREGVLPLLHIEAHGDKDATGYAGPDGAGNEERLSWDEMRDTLVRINSASRANLVLFSAACWGLGAVMAATEGPLPFMVVAGPTLKVLPGPLLEATKEFYRHALPKDMKTASFEMAIESAARELGQIEGILFDSMITMTYRSLRKGLWTKCEPNRLRRDALNMSEAMPKHGRVVDLGVLPYSTALMLLHQKQGQAALATWRKRMLLNTYPENEQRFGFDVERMVKLILDERCAQG